VATPIGNLADLSPRAVGALTDAELWIVEDTRVSSKLQSHLGIKRPMKVLNDHSTEAQVERLLDEVRRHHVVLMTDGGTPAISDPGSRLTDLAYEAGFEVDGIPGPSAVTNALMLSGFFAQRFAFLGFLPRKPGPIKQEFEPFAGSSYTLVLFESPHRVAATLTLAAEILGDRRFAACREMTKMHQEVVRGRLGNQDCVTNLQARGEYCIVIEGKRRRESAENE
jgi:16S rRNA (cytidine1402-2'-O)-methyltransferase